MDKRKRQDRMQWVTPGVFTGGTALQEMVEHMSITTQHERKESKSFPLEKGEELEEKVKRLESQLKEWEQRWMKQMKAAQHEREHLQQLVLMLKKEWEMERDEHRNR